MATPTLSKINVDVTLNDKPATFYIPTVERRCNEGPRVLQNLFAITRFFLFISFFFFTYLLFLG